MSERWALEDRGGETWLGAEFYHVDNATSEAERVSNNGEKLIL